MKISKKKTMFTRIITTMLTMVMFAVIFSFSTVSVMAMAADESPAVSAEELFIIEPETEISDTAVIYLENSVFETPLLNNSDDEMNFVMLAGAGDGGSGGGAKSSEDTYQTVIEFFITWFRRVGMIVAFVGAIMFALAIKNNDAEQKQAGLITMIAGFVVAAICQAADMFDLFS